MKNIAKCFFIITTICILSCLTTILRAQSRSEAALEKIKENTASTVDQLIYIASKPEYDYARKLIIDEGGKPPTHAWSVSIQLRLIRNYLLKIIELLGGFETGEKTTGWIFHSYQDATKSIQNTQTGYGKKLEKDREQIQKLILSEQGNNRSDAAKREDTTFNTLFPRGDVYAVLDEKGNPIKEDENQEQAALEFIKNVGANIAYPLTATETENAKIRETNKKLPKGFQKPLRRATEASESEYINYRKMAYAMQSFVIRNLLDIYADRVPVKVTQDDQHQKRYFLESRARLLNLMNTDEPTNWEDAYKKRQTKMFQSGGAQSDKTPAQAITALFYYIRALNYGFSQITQDLDKLVVAQSMIITQNNFLSDFAVQSQKKASEAIKRQEARERQ